MSRCHLARCQQERKLIRREFNKWTKNLLLQIGLETISKNHFDFEINSFNQTNNLDEEKIPIDFNPDQTCLFCINRQECLSTKNLNQNNTNLYLNDDADPIINEDENSPLDLSLKSTTNLNSRSMFDIQSDMLPIYNPEEFYLSSPMNFDYLFQSIPNVNLFPSFPINQYQLNSSQPDDYIAQLAKQMAYLRMIQEIENQRNNNNNNTKSKITTNSPSILTESVHVNQIINDIMSRTLNDIFEEQIKQQTRASKQGELLFVKKQNNNNDDMKILKTNKQYMHNNQIHLSSSSSSSTSSLSSRCSPTIYNKNKNTRSLNQSSTHISNRRAREIIRNSKVIIGMDGKQIRPKRGQYRRYESEQLTKAVAAVLRNEMSVHKAGSYFGVPHSTLEYKVKERNTKMSTATTKTKIDLSPSIASITLHENNNSDLIQYESMDYNDAKDSTTIVDENESDDEEIQSYNSVALQLN